MLQCCVRLSSSSVCTECTVAKRCALEQKLLLTAYKNSYMKNRFWMNDQNEWPWPLFRGRIKVMSTLCYIRRWISRKPLETEAWLIQKTTNRKWHMGYQMVTWPITLRDPQKCCEEVRSAILATAWLLVLFTDAGTHFMQYTQQAIALSEYRQTSLHTFQWLLEYEISDFWKKTLKLRSAFPVSR